MQSNSREVEPSAGARSARRASPWAAMAACLVVGLMGGLVGGWLAGRAGRPPLGLVVQRDGALLARPPLAHALDRQLALDGGPIRIGITFRDGQGRWCRTFESAPDRLAGLACREPQGWTVRALAVWTPRQGLGAAASETPQAVTAAVDQTMSGTPADQAGEQAARARDWRP